MSESEKAIPVNVGETYDVSINAVGEKGDGIARVKGFVLFVPNVKKGEYVKIKITKVLKNVGFAEVVERLAEKPQEYHSRFATVSKEDLERIEEPKEKYEDTENFGEE